MKLPFLLISAVSACLACPLHAADLYVWHSSQMGPHQFTSIQSAVSAAHPGDTIHIGPGEYHESVTITQGGTAKAPLTLQGAGPGTSILDGSTRIPEEAWEDCGNHMYRVARNAMLDDDMVMLWEDGEPLQNVATLPLAQGDFLVSPRDPDARHALRDAACPLAIIETTPYIYLHPLHPQFTTTHRRIAITTASALLTVRGNHVVIRDLGLRKARGVANTGTIHIVGAKHVTIDHVEILHNSNAGIRLTNTRHTMIRRSYIHDNREPAIICDAGSSRDMTIEHNTLWANQQAHIVFKDRCDFKVAATIQGNIFGGVYARASEPTAVSIVTGHMQTSFGQHNFFVDTALDTHTEILRGLFFRSPQVIAHTERTPRPPLDAIAMQQIILHGQLPFVFAPQSTPTTGHPTVVRLEGGSGHAQLHVTIEALNATAVLPASIEASFNGLPMTVALDADGKGTNELPLSPWQNWLALSPPEGWHLALIEIETPKDIANNDRINHLKYN